MTRNFVLFSFLLLFVGAASAKEVEVESKKVFTRCLDETKKARKACTGGCGNIYADCYEREFAFVSLKVKELEDQLSASSCAAQNEKIKEIFNKFDAELELVDSFQNTWGGAEVKVNSRLLRYKTLDILKYDCAK